MQGLGFFIWQLSNMPAPATLAAQLKAGGVRWVIIKVLNGGELFNAKGGNQKLLKEYWAALKAAGVEPGGYQYVYGDQPGLEGDRAAEFIEEFDPAHFTIDAEGEYKRTGATKAAKAYTDKLKLNRLEVLFCSFRFPSLHGGTKPFPFAAFFNAASVDTIAPQIYWLDAHDPVAQLRRSYNEHRNGTASSPPTQKRFLPIGSAFGQSIKRLDGSTVWWEATVKDLQDFSQEARAFGAYGFWSLDWILTHNRTDYWNAITGQGEPQPPPSELREIVTPDLSLRSAPVFTDPNDATGTLFAKGIAGRKVKVTGQAVDGYLPVEAWVWEKGLK